MSDEPCVLGHHPNRIDVVLDLSLRPTSSPELNPRNREPDLRSTSRFRDNDEQLNVTHGISRDSTSSSSPSLPIFRSSVARVGRQQKATSMHDRRVMTRGASTNINQYGRMFTNGRPLPGDLRLQILQMSLEGMRPCEISRKLRISHGCVSKILNRYRKTGSLSPGQIGGSKPKVTTPDVINRVRQCKAENAQMFAWEIRQSLLEDGICSEKNIPSISSINRIIRDYTVGCSSNDTPIMTTYRYIPISSDESGDSDRTVEFQKTSGQEQEHMQKRETFNCRRPEMTCAQSIKGNGSIGSNQLLHFPNRDDSCAGSWTVAKDIWYRRMDVWDFELHQPSTVSKRDCHEGDNAYYQPEDSAAGRCSKLESNKDVIFGRCFADAAESGLQSNCSQMTADSKQRSQQKSRQEVTQHTELASLQESSGAELNCTRNNYSPEDTCATPSAAVDLSLARRQRRSLTMADTHQISSFPYEYAPITNSLGTIPSIKFDGTFPRHCYSFSREAPLDLTSHFSGISENFRIQQTSEYRLTNS